MGGLGLFNFVISLQGFHATSFLLFFASTFSKSIRKWASYTEARAILVAVALLLYHCVMYAILSAWALFHVIFWPWIVFLISIVFLKVRASLNALDFQNL